MSKDQLGAERKGPIVPEGAALNQRTGELANYEFQGFDKDGRLVFSRSSDGGFFNELATRWIETGPFSEDFDALFEFSEMKTQNDYQAYAEKHGPLFGTLFEKNGLITESLEMWEYAVALMSFGVELLAARDEVGGWRKLQDSLVGFDCEIKLPPAKMRTYDKGSRVFVEGREPTVLVAKSRIPFPPEEYRAFTLDQGREYESGFWRSSRWDSPGFEEHWWRTRPNAALGAFDHAEDDARATRFENSCANLVAAISFNCENDSTLPPDTDDWVRVPLEDAAAISDSAGSMLCGSLAKALVSIHTRNARFTWLGDEYWPTFNERIRHLWYLFAVRMSKSTFSYCPRCGKPFMKYKSDKIYCTQKCKRAAQKERASKR